MAYSSSHPIVRQGLIPVVSNPYYGVSRSHGYGVTSVERFAKRYGKKKLDKLQKKLAKFERRYNRLISRGEPFMFKGMYRRRTQRLANKIQALQSLLQMQPFEEGLQDEAMLEMQGGMPSSSPINPTIMLAVGSLAIIGLAVAFWPKGK